MSCLSGNSENPRWEEKIEELEKDIVFYKAEIAAIDAAMNDQATYITSLEDKFYRLEQELEECKNILENVEYEMNKWKGR